MVNWSDSFWGDGNRGFEVLSSNIKIGAIAIEEFQRFLNESAQCETSYSKNLSRLQSQFSKIQHLGTFTPIWSLIRDLLDKTASVHLTTVNLYQDLLRDIHNYQELYQKKVKTQIQKDGDITRTADLITNLNNALNAVNRAKEQYYSIALDYERAKRTGNSHLSPSSTSGSHDNNSPSLAQAALNTLTANRTDRLERKCRQAQEEYKLTIEKYNIVRNDYEKRFSDAASKFQAFEIDHIEKMLAFSLNYSEILHRTTEQIRTSQNEYNDKLKSLTGTELLDAFVEQKKTGTDRPAVLQFEEVDAGKTSMQLPDVPPAQDDTNLFTLNEPNVPSFQVHFPLPSLSAKHSDNTRGSETHLPSNDPVTSPVSVHSIPQSPMNSMTRSQDNNNGNEQIPNPFDVKIKKTKFPRLFRTNRKDEDQNKKKLEKNLSVTSKSIRPSSRLGRNLNHTNSDATDFMTMTDTNDAYVQVSINNNRNKCETPEPYTRSSPSNSNDDSHGRIQFPSSKASKSSSSSDTSDDDDDDNGLMTKISILKINEPKTQILSDEGDDAKIMNAMRLIDQNIGNLSTNTRGLPTRTPDVNKPVSKSLAPPPPPPRSSATTTTTNNVDHSNMFPSNDEFSQTAFNPSNKSSLNFESPFRPSPSTSESKNTTSLSSNDDDTEVANSFPHNDFINKTTAFPILQVPSLFQSYRLQQQQSASNSMSPSIMSIQQSSNNSPTNFNEFASSPLTLGATDQIPLAIALQETIHVMISGDNKENWKTRIIGQLLVSFPSSMLNFLSDSSRTTNALEFRLKNLDNIDNIITKPALIIQNQISTNSDEFLYSFDMTELTNILRNLQEKNPSSPFYNLNVLNYELKQTDVLNIPIEISSQWTRTINTISVNIKYHFNSSILSESIRFTNNNTVIFYTIIADGQQIKESSPTAEWSENEHKLWWKVPYTSNGTGNLTATVMTKQTNTNDNDDDDDNEQPLTTASIVKVYFVGENALLSAIDFDLTSRGYRISLLKKKILSGKYQSEPDQDEPIQLFKRPSKSPSSDT